MEGIWGGVEQASAIGSVAAGTPQRKAKRTAVHMAYSSFCQTTSTPKVVIVDIHILISLVAIVRPKSRRCKTDLMHPDAFCVRSPWAIPRRERLDSDKRVSDPSEASTVCNTARYGERRIGCRHGARSMPKHLPHHR